MTEHAKATTVRHRSRIDTLASAVSVQRIEALICTGSPGLYRVVVFFAIQHVYSLAELGRTASSMSIAQMVAFFTAIGWATLILVRVPAATTERSAVSAFYHVGAMSLVTTVLCTVLGLGIAVSKVIPFDLCAFLALLWSWTAYQIARHYFVALKRYRAAIAFDVALIGGSAGTLAIFRYAGLSAAAALATGLGLIAIAMFVKIGRPDLQMLPRKLEIEGLQFGLTNFLSGGIPLIFVPAATVMCGAAFAGMLSLLSSGIAIGMLLPRAISMMQLADLAKRKAAFLSLDESLRRMSRCINWCNGAMLVCNVILVLLFTARQARDASFPTGVVLAGLLLAIQCAVGMTGVANSSVMMIFEQGAVTAKINVLTALAFALLVAPCYASGALTGFAMILCSAIVITVWRNWLIRRHAHLIYHQYLTRCRLADVSNTEVRLQSLVCGAPR
ncbi:MULTISPECIES: hypothetical protein [Paraburkholderia]|uniref:hypothetical protein n=1 Tax=Paraburkholderia TaxID=1822464 RepID=UPI0038B95E96